MDIPICRGVFVCNCYLKQDHSKITDSHYKLRLWYNNVSFLPNKLNFYRRHPCYTAVIRLTINRSILALPRLNSKNNVKIFNHYELRI